MPANQPAFGMGLEGLIESRGPGARHRQRDRYRAWNPADPGPRQAHFRPLARPARANKRALEKEFGLDQDDGPLFVWSAA
jgi:starch synthase